jgi:hypothetical protein
MCYVTSPPLPLSFLSQCILAVGSGLAGKVVSLSFPLGIVVLCFALCWLLDFYFFFYLFLLGLGCLLAILTGQFLPYISSCFVTRPILAYFISHSKLPDFEVLHHMVPILLCFALYFFIPGSFVYLLL